MSDVRASNWSVTINNPTPKDDEEIALARQKGWSVEGQQERGKEGTPHYQLHVKTPQVRFSAIKKVFSRAHIEVARNVSALANYVQKEETREGQLPVSQDQYPSLSKLWKLMYKWLVEVKEVKIYLDETDKRFVVKGPYIARFSEEHGVVRRSPLDIFDDFIKDMIISGYHVETMGINPQIRGCWNNYWHALLHREFNALANEKQDVDKKTDRQTDSSVASEDSLNYIV